MSKWTIILVWLASIVAACQPEQLGQCDLDDATEVVFDRDGNPSYAGQALVQEYCSSCHSELATGALRRGAPAALDFDMVGSRGVDDTAPDGAALDRLRASREVIFEVRADMFETVNEGSMPPDGVGDQAYAPAGYTRSDGSVLPDIQSEDGLDIYRNWLACGGPVVAIAAIGDGTQTPGSECAGPADLPEASDPERKARFACLVGEACEVGEVTWTRVFEDIMVPKCVGCHSQGTDFVGPSALDLCGGADTAACDAAVGYGALVGAAAAGDECPGGPNRVIASDPDGSLLVHKIEAVNPDGNPVCGDRMPITESLSTCEIDTIRAWIANGAMND